MSNKRQATNGGVGVVGILLVVFICAKVFEIAPIKDWSWWWVFSPVWIAAAVFIVLMAIVFLVMLIWEMCK